MFHFLLVLLLLASAKAISIRAQCPILEPQLSCACRTLTDKSGKEFSTVTCYHLDTVEELQKVLKASVGLSIFELELVDCAFKFLPHDGFVGTSMEVLSIRNSSLHSLSDSNVAFEGLDNNLHLLEIINCTYANEWDWAQLSNLRRLMEIHVSDSNLVDITNDMASVQHLNIQAFLFQRDNIEILADDAFAPFTFLERLSLDNNEISHLKRSMFPNPAINLKVLGLSYNNIRNLPENLFNNMPSIKSLYLTGNPLQTIGEAIFRPVWRQLTLLLFSETRLFCDCRIQWLAQQNNTGKYLHAECDGPRFFKGRLLSKLRPEELTC